MDEVSCINKNENEKGLFPYNSHKIKILGNDHNPPHFHVEKDDWDILFTIDKGELYRVNHFGKNESTYDYIVSNIPRWLQLQSANRPHETNQQNAIETWMENND
jgi:hypothetical protein